MSWLQSLDLSVLRLVRETLRNPFFDWLMPLLSGHLVFRPGAVFAIGLLAWKGGTRGRLCLMMLALVLAIGDGVICNQLKQAIGRPRPPRLALAPEVEPSSLYTQSGSMPSSHAANCFSVATVLFIYYRRSLRWMLPLSLAVAYSRLYTGSHYPTDVLAGAVLGIGYAGAIVWLANAYWHRHGWRWFPLWWAKLPSLVTPTPPLALPTPDNRHIPGGFSPDFSSSEHTELAQAELPCIPAHSRSEDSSAVSVPVQEMPTTSTRENAGLPLYRLPAWQLQWLHLGYVLIGLLLLARLAYLASGRIELGIDEAYQWVWSKHLALSYYSKPPLIAYAQRLGTSLFGDTAFGVRFLSPVSAALLSWLLLRFLARQGYVRAGFWLVLISAATPLLEVGATVLTVDCLLVLFWTAAMIAGWNAMAQGKTRSWLWPGFWLGLGCLSKYTALFQPICWGLFFLLSKPARVHLRRPGPYLALGIALLCTLPIWIWNAQHGWITLTHVASNARVDRPWEPTLRHCLEFTGSELGLLNPIFFAAALWAAAAFWRRHRDDSRLLFLFSMGAPLFLGYWLYTLHSRVLPNWIAASVTPLFCLMAIYWESRYRAGVGAVRGWLSAGLGLGLAATVVLHDTSTIGRLTGHPLPPDIDPLRQVRGWPETAEVVNQARLKLQAEGKPAFIICGHYGVTGLLSFYLPEAKAGVPNHPLVYYQSSDVPANQFFFWPGYRGRKGQNAIFVMETSNPNPAPTGLRREFASVTDLGLKEVPYHGRGLRHVQLFECRDLR